MIGSVRPIESLELDFDALYRRYQPMLVRFATGKGADDPEAAANQALFRLYQARNALRSTDDRSIRSYLIKATSSELVNQHRRRNRSLPTVAHDASIGAAGMERFDDRLVDAMLADELLSELSPAQRTTVIHKVVQGLTAEESGRLQGRKANAVDQLQHRAMTKLRRAAAGATTTVATTTTTASVLITWLKLGPPGTGT